ncbi:MAG: hypothetical protein KGQ59_08385, partial [Bdellovibrionales bacterium]|nr:hypothetical protein [Bdellovibrionales bacterium]
MKAGASIHRASVGGQLDYGLIGNCQISALIDRLGRISWCCMPRLDSSSIFGALLDESRGGFFSVEPEDWSDWSAQQEYLTNTNILRTVFESSDQSHAFEVVDFCPRYLRS